VPADRGGDDQLGRPVRTEVGVPDETAATPYAGCLGQPGLTGVREDVDVARVLAVQVQQGVLG
jgi:hypothetical protein